MEGVGFMSRVLVWFMLTSVGATISPAIKSPGTATHRGIGLPPPPHKGELNQEVQWLVDFKNGIKSDPNGVLRSWDPTNTDPCGWKPHITCDKRNSVTRINLRNCGLVGTLASELGNLKNLQYLLLNDNRLSGTIPTEISYLRSLKYLQLHNNNLSGCIPNSLTSLPKIKVMLIHRGNPYLKYCSSDIP